MTKGVSATYNYDQAKQMVLDAVAPLGEEYGTIVRKGFAERWIDVFPNKGKSGGAYSGGSYDSNPYIMCNFTGTLDSVSTIAHEMGHSMHSWFSRHTQPAQYADYTLFVAEVEDAKVLSDKEPLTYADYQANVKPKAPKKDPEKKIVAWRCKICGYVYKGSELPADYTCPLCGHGADDFEPVYE